MTAPAHTALLDRLIRAADHDGITKHVVGAVISDSVGRVLLLHRPAEDYLGGLWELPSGGAEPGEDLHAALRLLLASGCGFSSDRTTRADSPPVSSSAPSPGTGSPTPEISESSPVSESAAPEPSASETTEETATEDSPAPDEADPFNDWDSAGGATDRTPYSGALDCGSLPGSGTFSDPLRLGAVGVRPVIARGCLPLTPGSPFNVWYFSFTLVSAPGADAHAGASFSIDRDGIGPVYPAVIMPGGWILKHSLGSGYWTGTEPFFTGRYQAIPDLHPGTYILSTEKLDTAINSLTTPHYDVIVDADN
ncbi:NUDIX hydrolase [Streptomyces sp. NPDC004609]|uniref:NUDIX hydrolase n=1 Tax=Streptomyces sp. NPDC004609 TaxID=3364704 RepID=UPI003674D9C8